MEKNKTFLDEAELKRKLLENFLKPIAEQDSTLDEKLSAFHKTVNKPCTRGLKPVIDKEREKQIEEENKVIPLIIGTVMDRPHVLIQYYVCYYQLN